MAERTFVRSFCEAQERFVCTTTSELNFDNYADVGKYYIYEDTGNGTNKQYIVLVDYSKDGCKTQTKICGGNIESRCYKDNAWTSWKSTAGGSTIDTEEIQSIKEQAKTALETANEAMEVVQNKADISALELKADQSDLEVFQDNVYQNLANFNATFAKIGDVDALSTPTQKVIVDAINYLFSNKVDTIYFHDLLTSMSVDISYKADKAYVDTAVNELVADIESLPDKNYVDTAVSTAIGEALEGDY